jgi:putative methyltransferase (TIGR04325 family)
MPGSWVRLIKNGGRWLLPPLVVLALRRLARSLGLGGRLEWEFVPGGWQAASRFRHGWRHASVRDTQAAKWPRFRELTQGTGPLGVAHEAAALSRVDHDAHHLVMTFGYVLALAARCRNVVSLLDWGGGLGHYLVLGHSLLPGVTIRYTCVDLPDLCATGRVFLPDARFVDSGQALAGERYDLVLTSGSLQCVEDWKSTLADLARATGSYLYVTRLPVIQRSPSFVALQRPHRYGYQSESLSWFFNRDELLDATATTGLALEREFVFHRLPIVVGAPEQAEVRGFLFRHAGQP